MANRALYRQLTFNDDMTVMRPDGTQFPFIGPIHKNIYPADFADEDAFYRSAGPVVNYHGWRIKVVDRDATLFHGSYRAAAAAAVPEFPVSPIMPWMFLSASREYARMYGRAVHAPPPCPINCPQGMPADRFHRYPFANTVFVFRPKRRLRLLVTAIDWNIFRLLNDYTSPFTPGDHYTLNDLRRIAPVPIDDTPRNDFINAFQYFADSKAGRMSDYDNDKRVMLKLLPYLSTFGIDGIIAPKLNQYSANGDEVNWQPYGAEITVYRPIESLRRDYGSVWDFQHRESMGQRIGRRIRAGTCGGPNTGPFKKTPHRGQTRAQAAAVRQRVLTANVRRFGNQCSFMITPGKRCTRSIGSCYSKCCWQHNRVRKYRADGPNPRATYRQRIRAENCN